MTTLDALTKISSRTNVASDATEEERHNIVVLARVALSEVTANVSRVARDLSDEIAEGFDGPAETSAVTLGHLAVEAGELLTLIRNASRPAPDGLAI